jgi:aryl-alcohol dehydrogenase-like predicted oxidoreductase
MRFCQLAASGQLPRVASIQNAYNLLNRTFDSTLAECSHRENVSLLAYSPMAMGHLTGKYLNDRQGAHPYTSETRSYLDCVIAHYLSPQI